LLVAQLAGAYESAALPIVVAGLAALAVVRRLRRRRHAAAPNAKERPEGEGPDS
jgi:hypothetical protein